MDNIVFDILSSKSRRAALKYLFSLGGDATGRDLARHIGYSHQQALNALEQLVSFGLVERRAFGPVYLFRIRATDLSGKIEALLED
ncbi:MAG: winged helix-turn-helix domain-containing protein [Elusimicrobiales bacterium]|nr:winged helix-turn-helix domain-containing protein [Elusimicrobiales bacterium]